MFHCSAIAKTTVTTAGDIIYRNATVPVRLGIGTAGQVLTVNSGATAPQWSTPAGGGGKVLQVVQATYSTATTIASLTYTDTGLSLSITPTLATSKILVLVNQQRRFSKSSNDQGIGMRILRDSTVVFSAADSAFNYMGATGATGVFNHDVTALTYLDSPATTSSITYKTQGRVDDTTSSGSSVFQQGTNPSTITLLEIGV